MKLAIGRLASILLTAGGWVLFGVRTVLDLIGYSTAPEDIEVATTRLDQALRLFLAAPWWAYLGFALVSTVWLTWVSWPRTAVIQPSTPATTAEQAAEWKQAEPDIIKLLYDMAALSHELQLCRYCSGIDYGVDAAKMKSLLENVKDGAKFVYFDERIRLLVMGYIVACEQQVWIETQYRKVKAAGGKVEVSKAMEAAHAFLDDAPVRIAEVVGIDPKRLKPGRPSLQSHQVAAKDK